MLDFLLLLLCNRVTQMLFERISLGQMVFLAMKRSTLSQRKPPAGEQKGVPVPVHLVPLQFSITFCSPLANESSGHDTGVGYRKVFGPGLNKKINLPCSALLKALSSVC